LSSFKIITTSRPVICENKFLAIQAAKVYDDYKFNEIAYKIIYKNKFGKFKN
jgi:hypothetical protein